MVETPPPACPSCSTPYDSRHNKQHYSSPTCDWIQCGTPLPKPGNINTRCDTTYQPTNPARHTTD